MVARYMKAVSALSGTGATAATASVAAGAVSCAKATTGARSSALAAAIRLDSGESLEKDI